MPHSTTNTGDVSFEDFDPNKLGEGSPVWAVYDGYHLRTYKGRGPAVQSFQSERRAKIYQSVNGMWVLHGTKDEYDKPKHCTVCGQSTMTPRLKWDYRANIQVQVPGQFENSGRYEFDRRSGKIAPVLNVEFRCLSCSGVNH